MAEIVASWIVVLVHLDLVSSNTMHGSPWQRRKAALSAQLAARSPLTTAASQQTSNVRREIETD
jgi:hypothetical protein